MKYILKILGTFVYSNIMSYLLWLFFYWITPYVMWAGWLLMILYFVLAGGLLTAIVSTLTTTLFVPCTLLMRNDKAAKIINAVICIFWGCSSIMLPFHLDLDFGVRQWILALMLCSTAFIAFVSLITVPFRIENE